MTWNQRPSGLRRSIQAVAQLVPRHIGLGPGVRVGLVEDVDRGIAARAEIAVLAAVHDGIPEGEARLPDRLQPRQRILELPVGEDELVVAIVDDDARRKRFQHVGQPPPRRLGFGFAVGGHYQAGDIAADAAIAEECPFRAEAREAGYRDPAAVRTARDEFIDEIAKGPSRLEIVEMGFRLFRRSGSLLEEIEAEASEHLFGGNAGRLFIVFREPGEA